MTQTLTPIAELRVRGGWAAATITRESVPFGYRGDTIRPAFVVTTGTGYRATLMECLRDDCTDGTIQPCAQAKGHPVPGRVRDLDEHNRTHCHDWHEANVRRFAEAVLATYGYKLSKIPKGAPAPGVPLSKYRWDAYAR